MPQCIAAVFKAALKPLRALLSAPKGRHSAGQLGRRRSTRVRRYAPSAPATPAPLPSRPAAHNPQVSADERPRSKPPTGLKPSAGSKPPASSEPPTGPHTRTGLKPPTVEIDADDIALVRPYYTAHEPDGEAERIQDRATARLCAWGADLESDPEPVLRFGPAPAGTRAYTLDEYRDPVLDPDPVAAPVPEPPARPDAAFHVPAPRKPSPRLPARMNDLPHLSRIRARQQQRRRTTVHAGVSA